MQNYTRSCVVALALLISGSQVFAQNAGLPEGVPAEWMPWIDPDNENVILQDPDETRDVFRLRRDDSKDPARDAGLINLQRYETGIIPFGGFPTFLGAPMAMTTEDLKAAGVEVAMVGLTIGDNFIPGGQFAANKMRTLTDYMLFGTSSYDPTMHLDYVKSLTLADYGNVASHYGHTERSMEEVHTVISEILDADAIPMAIGGSHIQMYPMLTALAKKHGPKSFALLHVDAHYDALQAGLGRFVHNGRMIYLGVENGLIEGSDIIQVALRSPKPDSGDLKWMVDNKLKFHFQSEINTKGFDVVLQRVLNELKGKKVFVSFDMDGVDPAYAPGVGTQEPEGLTATQAMQLLRAVGIANEIVAVEINEYNPFMDDAHGTTGILMDRLMRSSLAGLAARKSGITDPLYVAETGLDHGQPAE